VSRAEQYRLLIADVYEAAATTRNTSAAIASTHGQSVARWHVLSVTSDQALTVAAAARRLGLARQGVQRITNQLVADGLLSAAPNPQHATAPLVRTTKAGMQVLAALVEEADRDREARLLRLDIGEHELAQARSTLTKVLAALSEQTS
jgi:DNA-binding MarR family transcriptional regulator